MEHLGVVLQSLRLDSTVLSLAHLGGDWGVSTRGAPGILLHGVIEGRCFVERTAAPGVLLELGPGEVVLFPRGEAHSLRATPRSEVTPITSLSTRPAGATRRLDVPGDAPQTRLVCGLARLDHPAARGLLDLLPPLLVARGVTPAQTRWLESSLALVAEEAVAGGAQLRSLVDALFARALVHAAQAGTAASGLLAAARDEQIGRALALVHAQPAGGLSTVELATRVGLSRTRFFERFTALVGEPPARYIARWRVHAAADLLRRQTLSTAEVAEQVGYSSEDALAKVFRRHLGVTPGQYRRGLASAG